MTTFHDLSVETFQDADAVYAHWQVQKSDMIPFFRITKDDVQPGIVFLSQVPLNDGIKWAKREIIEKRGNGETLWKSTSMDGSLMKYTTTRQVDRDKVSLAAYDLSPEGRDNFTPARIKYASISCFRARVLRDAQDVASGLAMEDSVERNWRDIGVGHGPSQECLDNLTQSSAPSNALASSSRSQNSESASIATHASLPADQFWNAATNRNDNWGPGTTRMGGQEAGTSWNVSTPRRRRKWGLMGRDVSRSEGGKRKASYDGPETRKIQKCSDYLEVSQPEGEQFATGASTSSSESDARYVGFGSPQLGEVTQSEAQDHAYTIPAVHPIHHHHHSLHESLTSQQGIFEEYLNPQERLANMFNIPCIPTWQPRLNLDHGLVAQHWHGNGKSFALHQDQHENFTPHLEYPPASESCHDGYLQNADQLHQHHDSFDESFTTQEGGLEDYGHLVQYGHGENFALQGTPVTSSQYMPISDVHQTQHRPLETLPRVWGYLPES